MQYKIIPVTLYQQNCSLIWCETTKLAALIDPGGETDRLINEIEKRGLTLEKILLTHGHLDHVGAADEIAKHCGVPILGPHIDDAFWLKWLPEQAEMFNFPPIAAFLPSHWLQEDEIINVGEIKLQVIHCPGHTPGHIVLLDQESKILFAGDVIFNGSIGRTDFPKGNHKDLIQSIKQKLFILDDDVVIIPGHGPNTTIGHEKQFNPYLK